MRSGNNYQISEISPYSPATRPPKPLHFLRLFAPLCGHQKISSKTDNPHHPRRKSPPRDHPRPQEGNSGIVILRRDRLRPRLAFSADRSKRHRSHHRRPQIHGSQRLAKSRPRPHRLPNPFRQCRWSPPHRPGRNRLLYHRSRYSIQFHFKRIRLILIPSNSTSLQ